MNSDADAPNADAARGVRIMRPDPFGPTRLRSTLLLLLSLLVLTCRPAHDNHSRVETAGNPAGLTNGFYAVLKQAATPESARVDVANAVVLMYDHKYTDSAQDLPPEYISIDTSSYVPIILDGLPEARKDGRGWTLLSVTLARDQVKPLEVFTRTHLGGKVAILLDGEVITTHKIRSVIEEGKLQITRCGDNACDVLRAKLAK
jgi:hypothetical protein